MQDRSALVQIPEFCKFNFSLPASLCWQTNAEGEAKNRAEGGGWRGGRFVMGGG